MWRLSGELAVNCSTLVDLPRQTHGLRWMRDELMPWRSFALSEHSPVVGVTATNIHIHHFYYATRHDR